MLFPFNLQIFLKIVFIYSHADLADLADYFKPRIARMIFSLSQISQINTDFLRRTHAVKFLYIDVSCYVQPFFRKCSFICSLKTENVLEEALTCPLTLRNLMTAHI